MKIPSPRYWALTGAVIAVSLLSYFRFLNNYELISYDLRLKLRPPLKVSSDIVLIEISDDTLKNLGAWPLPRDFHASLVDVLKGFGVKSIVFDLIFSEPNIYDEIFSQAAKDAGNVHFPLAFYLQEPFIRGYFPLSSSKVLGGLVKTIQRNSAGDGQINVFVDPDGKIRRIPLFIKYEDVIVPNLGLEVACGWLGLDGKKVEFKRGRVLIDKRLSLPVSFNTSFLVNYPDTWQKSFKHLSYFEVLKAYSDIKKGTKPQLDLSLLKGKVCFIGLTATGTSDLRANPLESVYPMLGLQASVFNSVIQHEFISDIGPLANTLIDVFILLLSFLFCLKLKPLRAFVVNSFFAIVYLCLAITVFIFWGLWIDLFFPLAIIFLSYVVSLLYRFLSELRRRQLLEKELDIARTIQQSFLPQGIEEFQGWRIGACMEPAKFVAGDLYDIVPLSDKKLGVLIGDVSGKGVPAALIMAQTISLFRIFSRQYGSSSEVLKRINEELFGKFGGRFVTALYMIIDTQNNSISVSSAGQAPLLFYQKQEDKISEAELKVDLPLGIMEGAEYQETVLNLKSGDKLVVFTDGVSEARNIRQQEFGTQAVEKLLLEKNDLSAQGLLAALKENLRFFSRSCPQHDDITLIILEKAVA